MIDRYPIIVCLIGPSGSGKTTIAKNVISKGISQHYLLSTTTRPRRSGEDDSEYTFKEIIDPKDYVEYDTYAGNSYGIAIDDMNATLKYLRSVSVVTQKGYEAIASAYGSVAAIIPVYIDSTITVLRSRILARGGSKETVNSRLSLLSDNRTLIKEKPFRFYNIEKCDIESISSSIEKIYELIETLGDAVEYVKEQAVKEATDAETGMETSVETGTETSVETGTETSAVPGEQDGN